MDKETLILTPGVIVLGILWTAVVVLSIFDRDEATPALELAGLGTILWALSQ